MSFICSLTAMAEYVPLGPLPPEINPPIPFQPVPNVPLMLETLPSDSLRVRQAAADDVSEHFAAAGLPHCIEDIEFCDNRPTKSLRNSVSAMFQRSTQFRYNQNIEMFGENFYYNMRTCSHGSSCCKPECIKDIYMRNMTTITNIYNEKCRQRWLWPWCKLCRLWICIPCFTSCVNACIPVEPIAQNRDKRICHCYFQRVCKAHVARFRHFFPKYKFATCPTQFKCSRSNVPLKEWSGLMSEKRFEEQEYKEGRLHEQIFM